MASRGEREAFFFNAVERLSSASVVQRRAGPPGVAVYSQMRR
jgi:hypothetical protein